MKKRTRKANQIRYPQIIPNFCPNADGSVLFEMGSTRVICAACVSDIVPDHAKNAGHGWVTAEYSLLPYSTCPRSKRPLQKLDGRSVEIQRLIGRSLRGIVDLSKLQNHVINIDCDVLQADGGTRTASITGGFIALKMAINNLLEKGLISENPILANVAAISVGYVNKELLLDLDYEEDSHADVDFNVVMDSKGNLIEIQGTGENSTFTIPQLNDMIDLAVKGIGELIEVQNKN